MKSRHLSLILAAVVVAASCSRPKDGTYSFRILTTNDIHGTFFDSTYVGGNVKKSLYSVKWTVDSVRASVGKENVVLIDAGDILQGDNAAYYFNYVDTITPHVYPRMAKYMDYDAVVLGNHDIETGHAVYDRVARDMKAQKIPFLSGNAIRNDNGTPYFQTYTILKRKGLKIAVLGYDNANIAGWLSERLWYGMKFVNLIPIVQQDVDRVIAKEKPHVVIVAVHSATGDGDGKQLESQGLDLMKTLHGVDFLICSHDHRPKVIESDTLCLINSGSHCRYVGEGKLDLTVSKHKVSSKILSAKLLLVDRYNIDTEMASMFHDDYPYSTSEFLDRLYRKPNPNRFLASLASFADRHQKEPYMQAVLRQCFQAFFEQMAFFGGHASLPLNVVGGLVSSFNGVLRAVAAERGIALGTMVSSPIEGLVRFHAK